MRSIETSIHYPPVHHFQIHHDEWQKSAATLQLTEEAASRVVTLPLYPTMSDEQVRWLAQAVKEARQETNAR